MQVRCGACSTTFTVGDDIVRVVRKRGGTVPCRSCKAPVVIPAAGPADAAKPGGIENSTLNPAPVTPNPAAVTPKSAPLVAKPAPVAAKPVEPAKPKPVAVGGLAKVAPAAPPRSAVPPVPAHPAAASGPHAPPPLPTPRASNKTRSLPPPVRSVAPKPPVPISADEWVEAEPEDAPAVEPSPAPLPARHVPPLPAITTLTLSESPPGAVVLHGTSKAPPGIMLSASEYPPAAIVTVSTSLPAPDQVVPSPIEKAAPPPLPAARVDERASSSNADEQPPTPTVTASTIDLPRAPLVPSVALADTDVSAPRARTKARLPVVLATALLAAVGLWVLVRGRSGGSDEATTSKNLAVREDPRTPAPVAIPSPPASAEAPSPIANVEAPSPAESAQAPSPPAAVEAPSPAATLETPAPTPAEKKAPSSNPTRPSETVAAQKPSGPTAAPAPKGAPVPETDLSSLSPKPTKADSRADDGAVQDALAQAAERAKGCRDATSPTGVARVAVTIAPSGDVSGAVVQGPPFAHTMEGECIAAKFRAMHVPPFNGDSINVRKSVSLQ